MASLTQLANPARFLAFSARLLPWLAGAAAILFALGLTLALVGSPPDDEMHDGVRIMYVHVPAAIMAMACYTLMAVAALGTLVWRHPLADVAAKAAAPIGAAFTFLGLVTGSIWGEPMWGTWWVWDARLTSFLVLFIMYLGLIALWRAFDEPSRAARVAAVLILVGFVNIPIIKFSVDWWNTLHQPASILRIGTPAVDAAMLWPLLVMLAAYAVCFLAVHLAAMRAEIFRRRVRTAELMAARPQSPLQPPSRDRASGAVTHLWYIVASYGVSAIVLLAMVAWVVLDLAAQRRKLGVLEPGGDRRRQERAAMTGTMAEAEAARSRTRLWTLLPLAGFLALAALFYFRLGAGDPSRIPSALIDKPVPDFALPPIVDGEGGGAFRRDAVRAGVHVVNVWGSWCGPCRLEHPILMRLAEDPRFESSASTRRTCRRTPCASSARSATPSQRSAPIGRARSIDWGVYGVPETFIVKDGIIVHKFIGPLSEEGLATDFMPALEKALGSSAQSTGGDG